MLGQGLRSHLLLVERARLRHDDEPRLRGSSVGDRAPPGAAHHDGGGAQQRAELPIRPTLVMPRSHQRSFRPGDDDPPARRRAVGAPATGVECGAAGTDHDQRETTGAPLGQLRWGDRRSG